MCDLAELSDVSQPTVSHHLKVLRDARVVSSERRGTWVYYRVEPGMRPVVAALVALRHVEAMHADTPEPRASRFAAPARAHRRTPAGSWRHRF